MTRGNGEEDIQANAIPSELEKRMTTRIPNLSCTIRRIEVIQVAPYRAQAPSTTPLNWEFYWRPLGLTYQQHFLEKSYDSPYEYTKLIAHFRPVRHATTFDAAKAILESNHLDA